MAWLRCCVSHRPRFDSPGEALRGSAPGWAVEQGRYLSGVGGR